VAASALKQSYGQRAGRGEAILLLRHFLKINRSPKCGSGKGFATMKLKKELTRSLWTPGEKTLRNCV